MALNIPPGFNDGGNTTYKPYGTMPGAPIASVVVGVLKVQLVVKAWKNTHPEWYRVSVTKGKIQAGAPVAVVKCAREFRTLSEAVATYETWVEERRAALVKFAKDWL